MSEHELKSFIEAFERQGNRVASTLESLPAAGYDVRPDGGGRSLGEMAWHLAEIEAHMTYGIERGAFSFTEKPPGIERPREIAALAPGYRRMHADAIARVKNWKPEVLDRNVLFFDGKEHGVRDILWEATLHHSIHHLGQLVLMVRLAGGTPPGLYGPNRETTAAMREAAAARKA
jgi:uncharacterized damage-inducible protein DinB